MGSGITAPGSGITTPGIGISGVSHWIKDQPFWINKILRDKGSKFSSRLEPGIKNLGKITRSAMKKYTALRPCYEFNTAKRSFIHVCLLIAFFSVLVFGSLESDDRSCRRLPHCSLVNSSIKYNCRFANNEIKCYTAKRCYAVVNFSFVMF